MILLGVLWAVTLIAFVSGTTWIIRDRRRVRRTQAALRAEGQHRRAQMMQRAQLRVATRRALPPPPTTNHLPSAPPRLTTRTRYSNPNLPRSACPKCGRMITITKTGRFRVHGGEPSCSGSGMIFAPFMIYEEPF